MVRANTMKTSNWNNKYSERGRNREKKALHSFSSRGPRGKHCRLGEGK